MLRAALYARVSTELQKDEETVQNQLSEIRQAIKDWTGSLFCPGWVLRYHSNNNIFL